jgi:hypothetical protein
LLSCDDPSWDETVFRLPGADIYFSAGWQRTGVAALGEAEPILFHIEDGRGTLVHTTLKRSIPGHEHRCDLETAYGYGGPLSTTRDPEFIDQAWQAYRRAASDLGAVAEFIRCHPLAENWGLCRAPAVAVFDRETVVVEIGASSEEQLSQSAGQHRRNLKKALASGVTVAQEPVSEGLAEFRAIYSATMERAGAAGFYKFSDGYFDALKALGPERLILFVARLMQRPVAAALCLVSGATLHYHLGGALQSALDLRPMNALFHGIFNWARNHGLARAHLGGGRTAAEDDTLLRFKSTLGRGRAQFHFVKQVFDSAAYDGLAEEWRSRSGQSQLPPQVLFWRMPSQLSASAA